MTMKAIEWLDLDSINLVNPRREKPWAIDNGINARLWTLPCESILHRRRLYGRNLT